MKILSIRQPHAYLIIEGIKTIENRTWETDYRGRLLIHASKTYDWKGHQHYMDKGIISMGHLNDALNSPRGGIIGSVNLELIFNPGTGIQNPWRDFNKYGWLFTYPEYRHFVLCKGKLGLFDLEDQC